MSSRRSTIACLVVTAAIASTPLAVPGQPASTGASYRPGLGDLMTMTVQPRHLKIGLAGQERNWAYLGYELHELEEALERVAEAWPTWRNNDIAGLVVGSTKEPMEALEAAVKAKDVVRFDAAYTRLTAACNACHQSANVAMVVIQWPRSSPFANQDFRPARP
jgi:uncharacterized SAM-binding protein YcdF (DUF218 family)